MQERPVVVTCDHCKGNMTAAELAVDCVLVLVAWRCVYCTTKLFGGWESFESLYV